MAKKLKNEKGLLREALQIIMDDATKRGIVEFEATDSHDLKIEYAYRLLVHDKEISPCHLTSYRYRTSAAGWRCG